MDECSHRPNSRTRSAENLLTLQGIPLHTSGSVFNGQCLEKEFRDNCSLKRLRRNCLLKQVIEGKIKGEMDVTRRRGRRRKKLQDDLNNGRVTLI
jgi:hypothetical protein